MCSKETFGFVGVGSASDQNNEWGVCVSVMFPKIQSKAKGAEIELTNWK